jgi:hyperosmotically inducible protein
LGNDEETLAVPIIRSFFAVWVAVVMAVPPAAAIDFNPLSAIKSAVEAAAEDRSSGDIAKDLEIKTKITVNVIDKMGSDVVSISADVYEQDVMLTGSVETAKQKSEAGTLAKAVEGVKKVYNEIIVIKAVEKEKGVVENFVDDSVIETKVNALLLDGADVNVTNFRWRSVGGRVFLFGRALSKAENEKATRIVKGIKGVRSVTNRAKIRPKE